MQQSLVALGALCSVAVVSGNGVSRFECADGWTLFRGNCYQRAEAGDGSLIKKGWQEAQDHCQTLGANLASIGDSDDAGVLAYICGVGPDGSSLGDTNCWFGLNDMEKEGEFKNADGTKAVYFEWAKKKTANGVSYQPDDEGDLPQDCGLTAESAECSADCVGLNSDDGAFSDYGCGKQMPFVCQIPAKEEFGAYSYRLSLMKSEDMDTKLTIRELALFQSGDCTGTPLSFEGVTFQSSSSVRSGSGVVDTVMDVLSYFFGSMGSSDSSDDTTTQSDDGPGAAALDAETPPPPRPATTTTTQTASEGEEGSSSRRLQSTWSDWMQWAFGTDHNSTSSSDSETTDAVAKEETQSTEPDYTLLHDREGLTGTTLGCSDRSDTECRVWLDFSFGEPTDVKCAVVEAVLEGTDDGTEVTMKLGKYRASGWESVGYSVKTGQPEVLRIPATSSMNNFYAQKNVPTDLNIPVGNLATNTQTVDSRVKFFQPAPGAMSCSQAAHSTTVKGIDTTTAPSVTTKSGDVAQTVPKGLQNADGSVTFQHWEGVTFTEPGFFEICHCFGECDSGAEGLWTNVGFVTVEGIYTHSSDEDLPSLSVMANEPFGLRVKGHGLTPAYVGATKATLKFIQEGQQCASGSVPNEKIWGSNCNPTDSSDCWSHPSEFTSSLQEWDGMAVLTRTPEVLDLCWCGGVCKDASSWEKIARVKVGVSFPNDGKDVTCAGAGHKPCENGGKCMRMPNGETSQCECPRGFTGIACEESYVTTDFVWVEIEEEVDGETKTRIAPGLLVADGEAAAQADAEEVKQFKETVKTEGKNADAPDWEARAELKG
uniref:EGF-like domain-containing protein n=1 Tax=Chromera velia CCMP2878 TaxID=1169474 RepID=A0A0G4FEG1_9ALVE|mmetsp:Transcript_42902/g.84621  ORF Transcript_42902/g.84621 Transcript_42902/m.84621 type:complete len:823 (+) Transcript_42902:145-2613(+)|eukprot:Cvel_3232.t1-p1 / transcript=Cvel_3232.t1 / gene=Cvel_3232 / organism=Chromera_velia_CCMP2878 / gene_product=Alpha-N-acetylgalactosamine-specific lectin, putative / transcript_product=Alpha-N-acetylgalactosamine-specific lectin, putative / location=Cvel_scaffold126:116001-119788(-) / protein_length=822 / sequence_SO=supercontig / SO=protein_coding / is_pseudo=false